MGRTSFLRRLTALILALGISASLSAQERPVKRVAMIVNVAMSEYALAVDDRGRVVNEIEFEEAVTFLSDAREAAARLSGERAPLIRSMLDSMSSAVNRKAPPTAVRAIHQGVLQSMGPDAALDLPTKQLDPAEGQQLYAVNCASCHGERGRGDGPAAKGLNPPPPALGDAVAMADVTPAMMYNILSVGVAGTSMAGWATTLTPDQRWNVIAYLKELRAPTPSAPGEGLYLQRCAGCHGVTGLSDGELTRALSRLPAELSSFAWHVDRSDAQIGATIRDGVTGTAMPPARELSPVEISQLVAHVRRLALEDVPAVVAGADSVGGASAAARVLALLDEALAAMRAGRRADGSDRAFDSYIAFEPLETVARARNPGLVASMERQFADFKGAIKAGDSRSAERARDALEAGMPAILDLVRPTTGFWGNFLQSFLIIFREGLEAILVIGAVVTFLVRTGNRRRLRAVWIGVGAALVASGVTAVILATVLRALPATREIIEGATMLVAVAVLFSVSYWLISKVEAAKWQQFIKDKVNDALQHGGGRALAVVAFLAVYREGAETALFYQALLRDGAGVPIGLGILVGGAALAVLFTLFYRYGVRLPLRPFFAGTSALLYYMAFVFMGKGIRELQEGNVVPITVLPGWPHVEVMGIYPSVQTLLAQLFLLVLFAFALLKTFWPRRSVSLPTVPASPAPTEMDQRVEALEQKVREMEQSLVVEERL